MALSSASCASGGHSGCPPLVTYSPSQLHQAATELRTLPHGSMVGVLVTDYGKTRDACR